MSRFRDCMPLVSEHSPCGVGTCPNDVLGTRPIIALSSSYVSPPLPVRNGIQPKTQFQAIVRCLEADEDPSFPLMIKTDSKYSISCESQHVVPLHKKVDTNTTSLVGYNTGVRDWIPGWVRRGWRNSTGKPVKNKAVIQHLANLLDNRPGKVNFQHVK